ncbi:hypothetical protein [Actinospica robiniae]|uniref:hypothetical protein n=1 Tax=Actinospica robiniae TaxID=304901 RepID=UPI0003FAB661|nr:hypothetical protein [Actinospica robiniae]
MDGLDALQELRKSRLISERAYQAHAAAVLRRLGPHLTVPQNAERPTVYELVAEYNAVERRQANAPHLRQAPATGPVDTLHRRWWLTQHTCS